MVTQQLWLDSGGRGTGSVQQQTLEVNRIAVSVNWENHSLNLARVHANGVQHVVDNVLDFLKNCLLFSSFTSHLEVLTSFISRTVKRQCDTRWSPPPHDAAKVSYEECDDNVIGSLEHLQEGEFSRDIQSEAGSLLKSIKQFPFLSLFNL